MVHDDNRFKKTLRPIDVWGLALGAIIGWGCFVLPGNEFLPKAGPLGMALGMIGGALLVLVISLSYGYLIRHYPVSGGEFVYAKSAFGKTHAFICGWFIVLAYWSLVPLNATALALISRYLFPGVIQFGRMYEVAGWDVYAGEVIVASIFLVGLCLLNVRGIKSAGWVQTAIALCLVGSIFLVTGLVLIEGVEWCNINPLFQSGQPWYMSVLSIVALAPWAFLGFDCIPQAAEEYNFPHKKSRNLMITAIFVAAFLYICINTITAVGIKPWQTLLSERPFWATGLVVQERLGKFGLTLIGFSMFCGVVSGINAFIISTSRLMYAMAKENALPVFFGKMHKKYKTPVNAIWFVLLLSLVAPWFGREVLGWIVDMTSVGGAVGFLYTCASASVLAYRKKNYGYSVAGIAGTVISLAFVLLLLVPGMPGFLYEQALICLAVWIGLGFVFYIVIYPKYVKTNK